jgi:hypothetical protein
MRFKPLTDFALTRRGTWLIAALSAAPLLWGVFSRLSKHNHLFADFLQLSCAATQVRAHHALYAGGACPGMDAMPFVYIPAIAQGAAVLTSALGPRGFAALYSVVYLIAAGFLGWKLIASRTLPYPPAERAPLLTFITGSALSWGNIALPLAALIAATVDLIMTAPLLFCAAVAVASVFKPVFLVYLLALLYAPLPLLRRIVLIGASAIAGLAPTVLFMGFGGDEARQWTAQTVHYVLVQAPGYGFLGWTAALGFAGVGPWVIALFLLYAAAIVVSGWAAAARCDLSASERIWLGMGVAALLIPRLMRYDAFFLGLGVILLAGASRRLSPRYGRQITIGVYAVFALAWILNTVMGGKQLLLVTPLFSLLLFAVGIGAAYRGITPKVPDRGIRLDTADQGA